MAESAPTFWLDEDGKHFWWQHECTVPDTSHLEPDVAQWYRDQAVAPRMLPIGADGWQVAQREPLTINPSVLCGRCQLHGFITNGNWISC